MGKGHLYADKQMEQEPTLTTPKGIPDANWAPASTLDSTSVPFSLAQHETVGCRYNSLVEQLPHT